MTVSEIENELGAQYMSLASMIPEKLGHIAASPKDALAALVPDGRALVRSTLAMSAASVASLVIGSLAHGRGPWAGLNAVTSGVPAFRPRLFAKRGLSPKRLAVSAGLIAGGSLALALVQCTIGDRLTKSRFLRGAMAGLTAFGLDRLFMKDAYFRVMDDALGKPGMALSYGAVGAAYGLSTHPEEDAEERELDVSGGDISAGVPAMSM